MKKLVSMLLVVSMLLAFAVTGATVSAAAPEGGVAMEARPSSTINASSEFGTHFFTEDATQFLTYEDGDTYTFDIYGDKGLKVRVYYGSSVTLDNGTYKGVGSSTNATLIATNFTKAADGWETFEVVFENKYKVDLTAINYVSITAARGSSSSVSTTFYLKSANAVDCLVSNSHKHSWSTTYTYDDTYHWKECSTPECPITENRLKEGYRLHQFTDKVDLTCDVEGCSYSKPAPPEYQFFVDPTDYKVASNMVPTKDADKMKNDIMVLPIGDMSIPGVDTAYIYFTKEETERKNGFYLRREISYILAGYEEDYVVSGWIYFNDVENQNLIMQFIPDGCLDKTVGNNYTEKWAYRYSFKDHEGLVPGWNFVKIPLSEFKKGTEELENEHTTAAYNSLASNDKLVAVTFHDDEDANYGKYNFAIGTLALGTKAYTDAQTPETQDPNYNPGGSGSDEEDEEDEPQKPSYPTFFISSSEAGDDPSKPLVTGGGTSYWADVEGTETQAFYVKAPASTPFTVQHTGLRVSAKQGDKVYFTVYISDPTNIKDFQWEIASSGTCTGACIRYVLSKDAIKSLKPGWVTIPFELVESTGYDQGKYVYGKYSNYYGVGFGGGMTGNVDYSNINFFRIVIHLNSTQDTNFLFGCYNLVFGDVVSTGDSTPVVSIALLTLAAAIIAGGVVFYNKKRAVR